MVSYKWYHSKVKVVKIEMTLEADAIPKEMKPVKAGRGFGNPDEHREQLQCACAKGGSCHRAKHTEGMPCERYVTLSKSNRHKTCNGCRKNKTAKANQSGVSDGTVRPVSVPSVAPSADTSYLAVPMPMPMPPMSGHEIPAAIPSSMLSVNSAMANPNNEHKESVQCICMKGGQCHREKHAEGIQCERYVTLTKTNRHKMCNGCRKAKVKKTDRVHPDTLGGLQNQQYQMNAIPLQGMPMPMAMPTSMPIGDMPGSLMMPDVPHNIV